MNKTKMRAMKKSLLLIAALMLLNGSIFSQWIPKSIGLLPEGYGVVQMQAVNNSVIYALAVDYLLWIDGSPSPSTVVCMLKSIDGGDNWSIDTVTIATGNLPLDLMVVDEQTVYFTGLDGSSNYLFYTTDGGASWNYKVQNQVANSIGVFIKAFSSSDFLSFGWGQRVATSDDGGSTWMARTTPAMLPGEFFCESSGTNDIAIQSNHAWVPTSKGRVFISTDKGITWSIYNSSLYPNRCIQTIAFTDSIHGIVGSSFTSAPGTAPTMLAGTSDGGLTWSNLSSPPRYIENLTPVPGQAGTYVAVADTQVTQPGSMYTLDNGNSWTIIDSVNYYNSVTFFDQTHGWAGLGKPANANSPAIYKWEGPAVGYSNISVNYSKTTVFPNPANDQITVANIYGIFNKTDVSVFNFEGKLMITSQIINQNSAVLDVSRLTGGIYFIKLQSETEVEVLKLIIK
jgi:photosystem II stability/assembly factor-like uncharacterized protein